MGRGSSRPRNQNSPWRGHDGNADTECDALMVLVVLCCRRFFTIDESK